MEPIVDYWKDENGENIKFTFYDSELVDQFKPYKQCYGLCMNEEGLILLGRCPAVSVGIHKGAWTLPGGRPEKGETPLETLKRELLEEVDVVAGEIILLGAQKVENLDKPEEEIVYQLRFAVIIKELKEQTPDPDNGILWERIFVKPEEVNNYLNWGKIGQHIALKAKEWFENGNKNKLNQ